MNFRSGIGRASCCSSDETDLDEPTTEKESKKERKEKRNECATSRFTREICLRRTRLRIVKVHAAYARPSALNRRKERGKAGRGVGGGPEGASAIRESAATSGGSVDLAAKVRRYQLARHKKKGGNACVFTERDDSPSLFLLSRPTRSLPLPPVKEKRRLVIL